METEEEVQPYTMIDLLAFKCTNLNTALEKAKPSEHGKHILKYLEEVDKEHSPIEDFMEGKSQMT